MSLPINIDEVLRGRLVEWERLEFKESWNPEAILHTVCAFANDFHNLGGGYIIVGVAEEHGRPELPPIGIDPNKLDAVQQELLNLGYHKIQPAYHPITAPYEIDGRHILVIWCPGGQHRPYKAAESLSKENRAFHYFIRKQSSTVRAKGEDERELLSLAARIPFDDRVNQASSVGDLQASLIHSYLRDIKSRLAEEATRIDFVQLCRRLNIVDGPAEFLFPRNVGLMFFNEQPERFFPYTQIDVVHFPEGPGASSFSEQIYRGPLNRMIEDVLRHLRSIVIREHVIKHGDRAEADRFFNYPFAAIEEAIVNAVYHRSYEEREPIEVRILPDHITITSYPGADRSISLEDLRTGKVVSRRYRNRRIGDFLKELELTEGRGTGIPKIRGAMQSNGSPPAEFRTDEDRTFFTVVLPIHMRAPQASTQVSPQVSTQVNDLLNDRAIAILKFCLVPQDRTAIQRKLGMKSAKNIRDRHLKPLIADGLLEMTDPSHPNAPTQKYRTTDLGRARLAAQ
jgi:ATP-dependent DNA helicase RecG